MKLVKKAGKSIIKISRNEWTRIGNKSGWIKESALFGTLSMMLMNLTDKIIQNPEIADILEISELDTKENILNKLKNLTIKDLENLASKYDSFTYS